MNLIEIFEVIKIVARFMFCIFQKDIQTEINVLLITFLM